MALGRKSGHTTSSAPAIHVIAHDRMADRREMNADLVSPSGMEMGTKKVPRIEPSKAYDVGLGRPTIIDDCHTLPVSWIAGDWLVDCEGVGRQMTPRHQRIAADHPAVSDRRAQKSVGAVTFGHDEQSGCLLVEAMDHAGPLRVTLLCQTAAPPQQRIHQRAAPVSGCRVDDHSSWLVHHQQRIVLVDEADWDILAGNDALFDLRDLDPDDITFFQPIAGL